MDGCRVNLGGMRNLLSDCRAESRYSDWSHQINSRSDQLVCPQPRRSFNGRSQINFERSFTMHHEGDVDLDILAAIALDNESDDDLELGSDNDDNSFFFCGSPPLRSDNPLSHDPEFRYLGDFYGTAKSCSTSVPKRSPQSFSPAPARRIEGFTCGGSGRGNSGANRVLSALA